MKNNKKIQKIDALKKVSDLVTKYKSAFNLSNEDSVYILNSGISADSLHQLSCDLMYTPQLKNLFFIINSDGGSSGDAYEMAHLLHNSSEKIIGLIPYGAYSAATILSLAFSEIRFGKLGHLGPIDTQAYNYEAGHGYSFGSCENLIKCIDVVMDRSIEALNKSTENLIKYGDLNVSDSFQLSTNILDSITKPILSKIDPMVLGDYARAREVGLKYGMRILMDINGWSNKEAYDTCRALTYNYPSHAFKIGAIEAKKLGLKVKESSKSEISFMHSLYDIFKTYKDFQGFVRVDIDKKKTKVK